MLERKHYHFGTQKFLLFTKHCVKSVLIRSYSGPHFLAFGLKRTDTPYSVQRPENADHNKFEYGHFSCSEIVGLSFIGKKFNVQVFSPNEIIVLDSL